MALLTGLGSLLGGLSNTQASRTGTQSSTGNSSTAGSSLPVFNPAQTALQNATGTALQNFATNGPNLTPAMTSGTNAINNSYKSIGDRLMSSLSSRGFGNSGASGTSTLQTELGRSGAVGDLQSQLQAHAMDQQEQALRDATGFGFAAPGQTNTGTSATSSFGTSVAPGSVAAGTLSGGLTSILSQLNAAAAAGG